MTPQPQPTERLEKKLARVAREKGLDQERLRRWVSFLALCAVLERALRERVLGSYFLKGGVALELRFATRARATKDLDVGLEGPRGGRIALLTSALAMGFDEFTFRLKAQIRDMKEVDTLRVQVAILYRGRAWQTVEIDMGPVGGETVDLVDPQVAGLAELGLPVTSPIRCLGLPDQIAQKIHACTSPHAAGRARDVVDILLIDSADQLDYARIADATRRVFARRGTHSFPARFEMPPEWRPELEALAMELGLEKSSATSIKQQFQTLLQRVAAVGSPLSSA